ncbi:hypothetical protein BGZ49_003733 [Haplosporangium sp. Z 27]|nr:hypothetical protein BGZ49_003733 [Haplosporangium sp. Z 27]
MSVLPTHLKWALEKSPGKEHVSFGNFVRHFNLSDKEAASQAFTLLVNSELIRSERRAKLQTAFKDFALHHEERFWAERDIQISSEVTAKQAGVKSQRVGIKQSGIAYDQYFSSIGEPTQDQNLRNDDQHLDMPQQKKARICLSPFPLHGASSVSSRHTPPYAGGQQIPPLNILFNSLQEGKSIPSWAKNRPLYTFILRLKEDWGLRVTSLYEAAKTKPILDHTHVDEIALLSGIVHLNKNHIGFSQSEISKISGEVLNMFYSKEMEDADMKRAEDANWAQKLRLDQLKERLAAQRGGREPVDISVEPLIETILSSYADCKAKKITSVFFIALHVFRQFNNWSGLCSESDCMTAVVSPVLREIMAIQHKIKFTCANACTTTGKTRKVNLQQSGQSRQPDVIGQTKDRNEVFFGEMKGKHPGSEAINTDILRLAIFTKDSLDLLHNALERGPPLVTFQTVGSDVVFFLGARVNNTIVHIRLSTVRLPSSLTEVDLDYDIFFRLFQVQTLISITKDCLEEKRTTPLQEDSFPTLGTPERNQALNSPKKPRKAKKNLQ